MKIQKDYYLDVYSTQSYRCRGRLTFYFFLTKCKTNSNWKPFVLVSPNTRTTPCWLIATIFRMSWREINKILYLKKSIFSKQIQDEKRISTKLQSKRINSRVNATIYDMMMCCYSFFVVRLFAHFFVFSLLTKAIKPKTHSEHSHTMFCFSFLCFLI